MNPCSTVLLTDLYQLTMVPAYVEQGMMDIAVFDFSSGGYRPNVAS